MIYRFNSINHSFELKSVLILLLFKPLFRFYSKNYSLKKLDFCVH